MKIVFSNFFCVHSCAWYEAMSSTEVAGMHYFATIGACETTEIRYIRYIALRTLIFRCTTNWEKKPFFSKIFKSLMYKSCLNLRVRERCANCFIFGSVRHVKTQKNAYFVVVSDTQNGSTWWRLASQIMFRTIFFFNTFVDQNFYYQRLFCEHHALYPKKAVFMCFQAKLWFYWQRLYDAGKSFLNSTYIYDYYIESIEISVFSWI